MDDSTIDVPIGADIPDFLVREVRSKLAYADEAIASVELKPAQRLVRLKLRRTAASVDLTALHAKVTKVVDSLMAGARPPEIKILFDELARPVPFDEPPMDLLEAAGELVEETTGVYSIGPRLASIMQYFEAQLNGMAAEFGARPYSFPALIPATFLEKVRYFRNFPHSLSFVSHLREDIDNIEAFAAHACCEHGTLVSPPERFAPVKVLLSPAVCYHLYLFLSGRTLDRDPHVAVTKGNTFRYESSNLRSLERLWTFTMWEMIFVGSKAVVLERIEAGYKAASAILQKAGMAFRIESATDPFFIGEYAVQSTYQSAYDLKYEFRARLPYSGDSLAVGSRNYHQDFFGRSTKISAQGGTTAHSGCVAFGLERLAYAFVAQYGLDPAHWPPALRDWDRQRAH